MSGGTTETKGSFDGLLGDKGENSSVPEFLGSKGEGSSNQICSRDVSVCSPF